ncbi:MAG: DUF1595 domain-containing protein [Candidatus Synoicihabitans palmerolidicus]|nr:DUF1595 domain-containing protein [Candidatus Synoicihabitans palmerolidicus]
MRAFRRPAEASTVKRLLNVATGVSKQPGETFESGIAQAMVAVLASPRFLFAKKRWSL